MGHARLAPAASKRCAYLRAPILRVVWSVHGKLQSSATIQSTFATPIVLFEKGIADPRSPQSSAETQKHDVVSAARSFTVLGGFHVAFFLRLVLESDCALVRNDTWWIVKLRSIMHSRG
jgi:hypothetical protein